MADDGNDEKKKALDKKVSDAKAALNQIKSQSQLDTVKSSIESLLACLDPEVLQALMIQAEATVNSNTTNLVANRGQEQKAQYEEAQRLQEQEEKNAKAADAVYKDFHAISPDYLKKQKEENKNLDEALEATKSGKGISEELKAKLEKNPAEIEEEKEKWEKIHNARTTAQKEEEHHTNEIQKIDENLSKLHPETHHSVIENLHTKRKFHDDRRIQAKQEIKETAKHYEEREKTAKKIIEGKQKAKNTGEKNFWDGREKEFEGIHKIPPEIGQHPLKVIEKTDKIKSALEKDNVKVNNKSKDVKVKEQNKAQVQGKNNSKTSEQAKNNKKTQAQNKSNKNTTQWSI